MFSVVVVFFKTLHVSLAKNNVYKVLIGMVFIMLTGTVCFYYFERPNIEELSFWDSLWWSFVTVTTVGYGDYFPVSFPGRIMAVILMITGIGAFGFVTAAVASAFVELNIKRRMGLLKLDLCNHVVIVGWNKKALNIVEELARETPERKIVVIDEIEQLETEYKQVYFVKGKGTEDCVLEKASVKDASLAIVLADDKAADEEGADAKAVMVCLAVNHINPKLRLVAEVGNEEHLPHFKRANVDEVFVSSVLSSKLLVRGAIYPSVSHVVNELITNSRGSEFYEMDLSDECAGMTFKQLVDDFMQKNKGIPIGVANEKGTKVNPDGSHILVKGDTLIYIGKNSYN